MLVKIFFKIKIRRILRRDGLWPFFAGLQYNDGGVQQFLPVKNRFSLLCGGVFPSVLRYVLLQGNAQLPDRPVL